MCLKAQFLALLVWLCSWSCQALRNATYQTFSLSSVCPLMHTSSSWDYSDNEVTNWQPAKPKQINLGLGVAALLDEKLNHSVFYHLQQEGPPRDIDCSFEISAGAGNRGIFIVVSHLNALRRFANGSCQDYLRISYSNLTSAAICGPVGLPGQSVLSYDSSSRRATVQLHLDGAVSPEPFKLRLKLVATSYFDCAQEREGFSCTSTNERCIPREYVGDGVVNCDMPSCRDEADCLGRDEEATRGDAEMLDNLSVTILIGLISFASTGLLFGLLLWICLRRNFKQRLNGNGNSAGLGMELAEGRGRTVTGEGVASGSGTRRERGRGGGGGGGIEGGEGISSAAGTPGSSDPPPSYDALFPDNK